MHNSERICEILFIDGIDGVFAANKIALYYIGYNFIVQ